MITDLTPYRKHVDQFDLTEAQKLDLVNALRAIVDNLFDQYFGINQLLLNDDFQNSVDCEVAGSNLTDGIHNLEKEDLIG